MLSTGILKKLRRWIQTLGNCWHATECVILEQIFTVCIYLEVKVMGLVDLQDVNNTAIEVTKSSRRLDIKFSEVPKNKRPLKK